MQTILRVSLVLLMVVTMAVACSQKSTEQQAAAPQQEQAQPVVQEQVQPVAQEQAQPAENTVAAQPQEGVVASEQAVKQPEEISGTVVRTEEGVALFSDSGNYMIAGQQLDELVGKNVKVTATMQEGSEKPTLSIISVSVVE